MNLDLEGRKNKVYFFKFYKNFNVVFAPIHITGKGCTLNSAPSIKHVYILDHIWR